ncbi:hypothetical protein [Chryseobacterium hispalense]|uniref:hypothetical protein n=1 Tax=Chryseobacterium hispalense TaxID=1453492 RepID=UPI00391BE10F
MQRQTLHEIQPATLNWTGDDLVDWVNGRRVLFPIGHDNNPLIRYHFAFPFDSAISSSDGVYSFVYKKLGTKGLLLKNGEVLREINRSYYHAHVYEYPAAFAKLKDGRDILIHCPNEYNQLEFEDVETGTLLTNTIDRKPEDFFHSRLEVSSDQKTLLSKGWVWHPYDFVEVFDIEECIKNPKALDQSRIKPETCAEINTASFINNELVLIGAPNETEPFDDEFPDQLQNGQIGIWNIVTNTVSGILTPECIIGGNLIAIDDTFAWELYEYPKIINYKTGKVVNEIKEISSGKQVSSIVFNNQELPLIAFNQRTKQIAIGNKDTIEILTWHNPDEQQPYY